MAACANAIVAVCKGHACPMQANEADASSGNAVRKGMLARIVFALFLALGLALVAPQSAEAASSTTKTSVKIGASSFTMKLARNDAAAAFRSYLSKARTLKMGELNGNEKYRYLSKSFPANPKRYKKVRAGDVMLYGDDCLVIFYKTHKTSYRYTKIGRLTSTKGLAKAVGKKSVKVRFSKMKQAKGLGRSVANTTGGEVLKLSSSATTDSGTGSVAGASAPAGDGGAPTDASSADAPSGSGVIQGVDLSLYVNGALVEVEWENNDSVKALAQMAEVAPVEIRMSGYGGFEQVGEIGASLPRNDVRITTSPGDVVLYAGNQLVLFYGANTWSYTKLGKIIGKTETELKALLGGEDVLIRVAKQVWAN